MADRRRRRRRASQDSEEDDESGSGSESGRPGSPTSKARGEQRRDSAEPAEVASSTTTTTATAHHQHQLQQRPPAAAKKNEAESECESEDGGVGEAVLSDYDSADPEENASHSEGGEEEEEEGEYHSDEEAPAAASEPLPPAAEEEPTVAADERDEGELLLEEEEQPEKAGGKEVKENLSGERQSGDGQESTDDPENKSPKVGQKLDDDEDRKNPAYIPRKGLFFEHDVRGHTQEEERPKGRNRKLWKDEGRWEHDRFREEEQAPKSRDELISIYGYDIRNNGGGPGDRGYRQRRPRNGTSPSRDKRWRDGGERPVRSWHSGGGGSSRGGPTTPPPSLHPSSSSVPPASSQRTHHHNNSLNRPPASHHGPPARRPPPHQSHISQQQYRNDDSNAPHHHHHPMRERQGPRTQPPEPAAHHSHRQGFSSADGERGGVNRGGRAGGRGGHSIAVEEMVGNRGDVEEREDAVPGVTATSASSQPGGYQSMSPRRHHHERGGGGDRSGLVTSSSPDAPAPQTSSVALTAANRETSPPTERPVERKSYSLARRTRSRPADMGSKQTSVDETTTTAALTSIPAASSSSPSPSSGVTVAAPPGGKGWTAVDTGAGGLTGMDQEMARLSLAGQNWTQSGPPTSYLRSEMRGLPPNPPIHMSSPQFPAMEELGVGSNRAKRYSSQRQRPVPDPAPPLHPHLGVMEGHYYEPMSYQGPIYTHGDSPAPMPPQGMPPQGMPPQGMPPQGMPPQGMPPQGMPPQGMPPQGMLVQPEMHIPHPALHPHQSGGPMGNPALYGAPPVSLSPAQPQQLLAPPFYPPPGVMTFPYPTMYPTPHNPQAQSQVYGGVTYYDTVQQQAQPKPSPPRRSSQPVSVKPPPPEVPFASE